MVRAQDKMLSAPELLEVVRRYHPVARQAALEIKAAKADVLAARGAFDPVATSYQSRKELEGLLYYDHRQHEVRIPTWYGIDVRTGVETLSGERTNPSDTKGTVSYVGISVPLLRNLALDKRRAVLRQAKLLYQSSLAERQSTLNDLFYDALKAYWTWWQHHQLLQVVREATTNAQKRHSMVRTAYRVGERPAIDTLEAYTQVQALQLREAEIAIEATKAQLELSLFLWTEGGEAYELPEDAAPQLTTSTLKDSATLHTHLVSVQDHPELRQYHYKLAALRLDRQLYFQSLLPSVYAHYNQLGKGYNLKETIASPWLQNNYRFGLSLSVPLRLSEGRGLYTKARIKLQQATLEQAHKRASLLAKVKQSFTQWQQLRSQRQIQEAAVVNYQVLQRGEETKFGNGESSLFLINSREAKTLEAKEKLISLTAKEHLAYAALQWTSGSLQQL